MRTSNFMYELYLNHVAEKRIRSHHLHIWQFRFRFEARSQIRGRGHLVSWAFGAAAPIEVLIKFLAVWFRADHIAAQDRVGIVVHTNSTTHALCPGSIFWNLDVLCQAQWATGSCVLWGNVLKGWFALKRLA